MSRANTRMVRQWLLHLMARLPISETPAEVEARAQLIAPSLADSYPLEAFSPASADYVLIDLAWFREADIRQRLNKWRMVHLPDLSSLPDEAANAPVDPEGRQWIARWLRCQSSATSLITLKLIKNYHSEAFAHLMRTDVQAANLALRQGWQDPSVSREAEWGDPAAVNRAVQSCFGHYRDGTNEDPTPAQIRSALQTLRWLVSKFAPHNLDLIPDGETLMGNPNDDRGWIDKAPGHMGGEAGLYR